MLLRDLLLCRPVFVLQLRRHQDDEAAVRWPLTERVLYLLLASVVVSVQGRWLLAELAVSLPPPIDAPVVTEEQVHILGDDGGVGQLHRCPPASGRHHLCTATGQAVASGLPIEVLKPDTG